jgi:LacI family transcriptional regulator
MVPKKNVTIQDIAKRANVSISTVSRVLNQNAPVTEAKQKAILSAMAELDYKPNVFAQGLASGQSRTIGVLTPYINSPFYGELMRGVVQGLENSGYTAIFSEAYWNLEREKQAIQNLLARRVDGLIIFAGESSGEALEQIERRLPVAVIGRDIPRFSGVCLRINDFEGAYQATKYLTDFGHRRVAHITGILSRQDAAARLAGYRQALADAGLPSEDQLIVEGDFSENSGLLAVQSLLLRGQTFSAIFAANDQMAYGARLGLYRRGLRVPEDISLIGFDDQPGSAYTVPPLTTVRQPALEMGQVAAGVILALLRDSSFTPPDFKAELVMRESVARFR